MKALSSLKNSLLLIGLLCCLGRQASAQSAWATYPTNMFYGSVTNLYNDTASGILYAVGSYVNDSTSILSNRILRIYPDGHYDTLAPLPNNWADAHVMTAWKGELYVGGSELYKYSLSGWQRIDNAPLYKPNVSVYTFIEYQNQLLIGGIFADSSFNGVQGEAYVVAYDGTHFTRFRRDDTVFRPGTIINDFEIYKGELIVGGNFEGHRPKRNPDFKEIVAWDGQHWHSLAHGIEGIGDELVYSLAVHNDELYVGGIFQEATGAPGNGLAKWDGSQWSKVGSDLGARHNWIYKLLFTGDTLNMAGNFEVDGLVHSPFARFLKGHFCYDPDTVLWQGRALGLNQGKVVLGGQKLWRSPTSETTALATFLGRDCYDPTSVTTSAKLPTWSVYPNPVIGGSFSLRSSNIQTTDAVTLKVYNALGQKVYQEILHPCSGSFSQQVNLGNTPPGLYLLQMGTAKEQFVQRLILE